MSTKCSQPPKQKEWDTVCMLEPLGRRWDWLSQGEAKGPWHPLRLAVLRVGFSSVLVDVPSWSPTYGHRDSPLAEEESDLLHLGSYCFFLRLADLGMVLGTQYSLLSKLASHSPERPPWTSVWTLGPLGKSIQRHNWVLSDI